MIKRGFPIWFSAIIKTVKSSDTSLMMMYFNIKSLKIKLLNSHDNEPQWGFKQSGIRKDTKLINFFYFLIDSTRSDNCTFSNILETGIAATFIREQ